MSQRECKAGWISQYTNYTKPQQSPTLYHTWVAISCIASALGRRVWLTRGYDSLTIYPNLYVILVSPPGVGNKTSAIRIGTNDILSKAIPQLTILRGALTIKYLIDLMSQAQAKSPTGDAEVMVFAEEFKVFSKGLYSDSGLIENLTKLFDNGIWEYGAGVGSYKVDRPCINMQAASTPEWLTTGKAADFIGGGFSSRIIPVSVAKDEKSVAWPEKTQVEKDLEPALLQDLAQIYMLSGPFIVTTDAKEYFKHWYDKKDQFKSPDKRLEGYFAKKHDLVLKVAMILSASLSDEMVITEEHMNFSLKLLGKMEETIPLAYQGVSWGETTKYQESVLMKIKDAGEITKAELLVHFRFMMSRKDMMEILSTLIDSDSICWDRVITGGRPRNIYKYKESRMKGGKCQDVTCTQFSNFPNCHPNVK